MLTKICTECGEDKILDEYYKAKAGKFGRVSKCKPCFSTKYDNGRRAKYHRLYTFGVDDSTYQGMLESQQGVCAICKGTNKNGKALAVDHNHATGDIRGLLCISCNTALGKFRDSEELLLRAINYLKGVEMIEQL